MSVDLPSSGPDVACQPHHRCFRPSPPVAAHDPVAHSRLAPRYQGWHLRYRSSAERARRRDDAPPARGRPDQGVGSHPSPAACDRDQAPKCAQPRRHAADRRRAHVSGSPHTCGPEAYDVPRSSLPSRVRSPNVAGEWSRSKSGGDTPIRPGEAVTGMESHSNLWPDDLDRRIRLPERHAMRATPVG